MLHEQGMRRDYPWFREVRSLSYRVGSRRACLHCERGVESCGEWKEEEGRPEKSLRDKAGDEVPQGGPDEDLHPLVFRCPSVPWEKDLGPGLGC